MESVRSLADKMDKLGALTAGTSGGQYYFLSSRHGFRSNLTPLYSALQLLGQTETADREIKARRITELDTNRWCNLEHVTEKERPCTLDVKLLAGSFCPSCLLRKFTYLPMLHVYSSDVVAKLQKQHPNTLMASSKDIYNTFLSLSAALQL